MLEHFETIGKIIAESHEEARAVTNVQINDLRAHIAEQRRAIDDDILSQVETLQAYADEKAQEATADNEAFHQEKLTELIEQREQIDLRLKELDDLKRTLEIQIDERYQSIDNFLKSHIDDNNEKAEQFVTQVLKDAGDLRDDTLERLTAAQDTISYAVESAASRIEELSQSVKDGEKGDPGEQGEPGQDRPLIEPVQLKADKDYDKNTVGSFRGSLWISTKKAVGNPEDDPAAWHCVIDSIDDMDIDLCDDHEYQLSLRMGTGTVHRKKFHIPYPEHKGIYEEDTTYLKGQIVTKGTAFWQAIEDTAKAPPGNGWQQILVAPRGKQGPPGKSITGPQGKPGRNGRDAEIPAGLIEEIKQLAIKRFEDGRSGAEAITSYRGFFDPAERYNAGDVLTFDNGLYLCIRSGRYESIARSAGAFEMMLIVPKIMNSPWMLWKGEWQPGTYQAGDTVRDGAYTMVALRKTQDTAAPIPGDDPYWITDNLTPATFPDSGNFVAAVLRYGNRYQAHIPGWISRSRVYIPAADADVRYQMITRVEGLEVYRSPTFNQQDITDAGFAIPGWAEINIPSLTVLVDESIDVSIESWSDANSTSLTESWSIRTHPNQNPTAGEIVQRNNSLETVLVNQVSQGGDQSAFMDNLKADDDMVISGITYNIVSITKVADRYELIISPGSALPTGTQDVTFVVYGTQPIDVAIENNYWGLNPPPSGIAQGFYQVDGQPELQNTNLYGTDVEFTPAYISPDWDIVAYSQAFVGGGGAV